MSFVIPSYMVHAHGVQHCSPRSVNLGNTLVIMNCDNSLLHISLEDYYEMMIFATSISDMNSSNIDDVLAKIDRFTRSFDKTGKNTGLCAYYGTCPNLFLSPITGGFMAKLPVQLYWEKCPNQPIPSEVLEQKLEERRDFITSPQAFDDPRYLSQLEKLSIWGWMNNPKNTNDNWTNASLPDKYYISSEVPLGSIYPMRRQQPDQQYLCYDESSTIGHTLHDVVRTIDKYDGGAPKILFVISCAIGDTNIREFSTPVTNIKCIMTRYIQSFFPNYKIVQQGGETYVKHGKTWYKVKISNGKLRLIKKT